MKYFLGFLAVVGLVIVVFFLVLGGLNSGKGSISKNHIVLSDYANTSTVMRLTTEGPVNADQNHRVVRITIGRDQNMIEEIRGYQGSVVKQQTYANNQQAYETFLKSLQLLNFTKGNTKSTIVDDRGYCPTGYRYTYEIVSGSTTPEHFWGSSCGQGNFQGLSANIRALFKAQIPDYAQFVSSSRL